MFSRIEEPPFCCQSNLPLLHRLCKSRPVQATLALNHLAFIKSLRIRLLSSMSRTANSRSPVVSILLDCKLHML